MIFLHNHENFKDLIEIAAQELNIEDPSLVEKDYWIMHCLYSLKSLGFKLELKGGTSLSKGFSVIHRFSEDIDVKVDPDGKTTGFAVFTGKNQDSKSQMESRKNYYDWIANFLQNKIDGIVNVERDLKFDDSKYRSGGIRLNYKAAFQLPDGIKEGILLELGFDRTAPNKVKDISSWAFDRAQSSLGKALLDNRAKGIPCYEPKYTFVEKLQAIITKYRKYKEGSKNGKLPENFLRHYYDVYCLLELKEVRDFIGTEEYKKYKIERFRSEDLVVKNCEGLRLSDPDEKAFFEKEYIKSRSLYYRGQIPMNELLKRIGEYLDRL